MKKSLILVYGILVTLTLATAFIANSSLISSVVVALIMVLSAIKFLLVAFQFMELKKANLFWKVSLCLTVGLLFSLIVFL
jgi:hypothetical protein